MNESSLSLEHILKEALGEKYSTLSSNLSKAVPSLETTPSPKEGPKQMTVDQILKKVFNDKQVILGQNK